MTIENLIVYGKKHLSSLEAKMLLAYVTGYDVLELLLHLDEEVSSDSCEKYKELIKARIDNYPIQYIVGSVDFLDCKMKVDTNVLIPRFETEDLVDRSIKYIKDYFDDKTIIKIADLGTGSGCIAIALKKAFPNAIVDAFDISKEALKVAEDNAKSNDVEINFYLGDMCDTLKKKYDVIISNPPYIDRDSNDVDNIVLEHEPHLALFAPNNGLYFYEEILKHVSSCLLDRGMIVFEIGYKQGESIKKLCNKYLPDSKFILEQDMSKRNRFVFIYK